MNATQFMNVNQFKEEIKRGFESVDIESIKYAVSLDTWPAKHSIMVVVAFYDFYDAWLQDL